MEHSLDISLPQSVHIASDLASNFEGLELSPYLDCAGFPTIGYGHLLSRKKFADLSQWEPVSHDRAIELLQQDLMKAYRSVDRLIRIDLTDNQEAALIDFTYNVGGGALQSSTLRKVINRGDFDEAPRQFRRWIYAGGKKWRGLVRRREAEAELFMS